MAFCTLSSLQYIAELRKIQDVLPIVHNWKTSSSIFEEGDKSNYYDEYKEQARNFKDKWLVELATGMF